LFETIVVEKIRIHILYSTEHHTTPPRKKNHAVYEKKWKNLVKPDRPQMTIKYGARPLHAG
jgi:hypothetical protein